MSEVADSILRIVESLLRAAGKADVKVGLDDALHGEDGLGLDSLQTAELSATLEDEFGTDPFSEGLVADTVGEIVSFYTTGGPSGAAVTA